MDDQTTQRPFRSSDSVGRASPAQSAGSTGNDPLAELARLIGQTDPFADYARKQQLAAPPPAFDPPAQTRASSQNAAPTLPPLPEPPSFIRQPFGGAPLAADHDPYLAEAHEQDYPAHGQEAGYDDQDYHQDAPHPHADYYDEAPSSRRRATVMVIAGAFALAVLGAGGAFGYRALFGSASSSAPPPVIKADTAPSKIVPASTREASNKLINDRVGDRGQTETLVSREEQPVVLQDRQAGSPFPPPSDQATATPAQGSGVISPDAKRVRTIAIRPDQPTIPETASPPPVAPSSPPRVTAVTPPARPAAPPAPPSPTPPQRAATAAPPPEPDADAAPTPAPKKPTAPRVPPAAAQNQASANAPLSLSPNAPSPARAPARPAAPAQTAAIAPAAAAAPSGGGGYAVQVSSQRSEAEAQAAFRALQGKYPDQLGNRQPIIRKVELGEKGTFYRALVPVGSGNDASQLCSSLKAAGGSCLIQRN